MKNRILPVIALLFLITIVSRSFALSNEALASSAKTATKPPAEQVKKIDSPTASRRETSAAITAPRRQCLTGDVLIAINTKMQEFERREAEMKEKESAYNAIKIRLGKQLIAIEVAKDSLDKKVKNRVEMAQGDLTHLTVMYQTMKPKQAAKIFNEMDINFAAGFIREMKGAHAGLILSNMNAKKAYQISLIIASKGAEYRMTDRGLP